MTRLLIRPTPPVLALILACGLGACDPGVPTSEGTAPVDRETFVETFVELRREALQWEGTRIPEGERDRILAEHGVTEGDLRTFIEVHGRNVPFMSLLWADVESRMMDTGEEGAPGPGPEGPSGDPALPGEEAALPLPGPR